MGGIKMDGNLFLDMLRIAIIGSIISSQIIQKIKHIMKLNSRINKLLSSLISFGVGYAYTLSFYSHELVYAVWIGIFTLIGAEGMYKSFKGSFGLQSLSKEK